MKRRVAAEAAAAAAAAVEGARRLVRVRLAWQEAEVEGQEAQEEEGVVEGRA